MTASLWLLVVALGEAARYWVHRINPSKVDCSMSILIAGILDLQLWPVKWSIYASPHVPVHCIKQTLRWLRR
ncbi:hypothetical protein M431DRAFT_204513 [Trichoderma harzianum CBS 226.95]|uniref:Uncharacterized protein n=1 Tax=Trichoderma harzianum CBS 226.95 TaxID=983964 RepID=A0A2T4AVN8_TRIHA|nr:hypothetical protein M431DRAFT_204513 [Trichoderma harzianum CBS 226.95]PTB61137.1 hypothetical protein M431DRAFT_204513 [Trichoderma harzianum CBS 226.95]